jgi:ribonuclease PH
MTVDSCNRPSGRRPDQMRDVSFELGFTKQASRQRFGVIW